MRTSGGRWRPSCQPPQGPRFCRSRPHSARPRGTSPNLLRRLVCPCGWHFHLDSQGTAEVFHDSTKMAVSSNFGEEQEPDGANDIFELDAKVIFLKSCCSLTRPVRGQAALRWSRTFAQLLALTRNGAPPARGPQLPTRQAQPLPTRQAQPLAGPLAASWGLALPPPHRGAGPGPTALHSPSASLGPDHEPQELTVRRPLSLSCPPSPAPRPVSPSPCPVSPQSSSTFWGELQRGGERLRATQR